MSRGSAVSLQSGNRALKLVASPSGLKVEYSGTATKTYWCKSTGVDSDVSTNYSWWHVVWIELEHDKLQLHVIHHTPRKTSGRLKTMWGRFKDSERDIIQEWSTAAMQHAYSHSQPCRRLRVLVNPVGGKGKAKNLWSEVAKPIFEAAHCPLDIKYTQYSKHAYQIAKTMPLDVDCLVPVSGDGLIHECINGLADHSTPEAAMKISLAPLPAGSANALCVNLLGVKNAFDVAEACLNVIKGKPMHLDLCSITQNGKRSWSFLSQALGLMAELDLDTEHLRWLGEPRFWYGYFRGLAANKPCPVKLEFKKPQRDKEMMLIDWNNQILKGESSTQQSIIESDLKVLSAETGSNAETEWVEFDKPWLYMVAGDMPYVLRDFMQFPIACASDGLVDIAIQEITTRSNLIKVTTTAKTGQFYFIKNIHYIKCEGYRVTPLQPKGHLAIDGERYPFEPYEVAVHRGMATVFSPSGSFPADFAGKPLRKL